MQTKATADDFVGVTKSFDAQTLKLLASMVRHKICLRGYVHSTLRPHLPLSVSYTLFKARSVPAVLVPQLLPATFSVVFGNVRQELQTFDELDDISFHICFHQVIQIYFAVSNKISEPSMNFTVRISILAFTR